MVGLTLVLFGNIPFEFFGIDVANGLVLLATCLSIYSGIEYYLGHFQKSSASSGYAKGGYGKDFPINKFVDKKKYLPKEFIIGYFYGKFDKLEIHFIGDHPM